MALPIRPSDLRFRSSLQETFDRPRKPQTHQNLSNSSDLRHSTFLSKKTSKTKTKDTLSFSRRPFDLIDGTVLQKRKHPSWCKIHLGPFSNPAASAHACPASLLRNRTKYRANTRVYRSVSVQLTLLKAACSTMH